MRLVVARYIWILPGLVLATCLMSCAHARSATPAEDQVLDLNRGQQDGLDRLFEAIQVSHVSLSPLSVLSVNDIELQFSEPLPSDLRCILDHTLDIDAANSIDLASALLLYYAIDATELASYVIGRLTDLDVDLLNEVAMFPGRRPPSDPVIARLYGFSLLADSASADFLTEFTAESIRVLETQEEDMHAYAVRSALHALADCLFDQDICHTILALNCLIRDYEWQTMELAIVGLFFSGYLGQIRGPMCADAMAPLVETCTREVVNASSSEDVEAWVSANLLAASGAEGLSRILVLAMSNRSGSATRVIAIRGLGHYCGLVREGRVPNEFSDDGVFREEDLYPDRLGIEGDQLTNAEISYLMVSTRIITSADQLRSNAEYLLRLRDRISNRYWVNNIDDIVEDLRKRGIL